METTNYAELWNKQAELFKTLAIILKNMNIPNIEPMEVNESAFPGISFFEKGFEKRAVHFYAYFEGTTLQYIIGFEEKAGEGNEITLLEREKPFTPNEIRAFLKLLFSL